MSNAEVKNDIIVKEYRWNWDIVRGALGNYSDICPSTSS